ncbi:hypothetical protein CY35_07G127000 [Sphagnum magellanicum]|uniref:Uncharacterized protein n=1 Tax=Sphagnum magellanicum TaxID=128215 RepID=A0ACB8HPR3_9BRYO|nr:hypothetical protein CY35_07G127000 [Sphagnum magellanicum]
MAACNALSTASNLGSQFSRNQFAVGDAYSSSHCVTPTTAHNGSSQGFIQAPIRISRKSGHGSKRNRCNYRLLRPSCALATPRHTTLDSVDRDWTSFNPAGPGSPTSPSQRNTKGWTDRNGVEDSMLVAQLRNIALAAEDRSEMHAIIGVQRDNWNKLCHMTVNMTTIAAAMLAAMNTGVGSTSLSMSVAAFLLNGGAAGFMFLASKYQPSQLAEEQRTASRFHKLLARDIETTLLMDPRLRKDAHLYMEEMMGRLQALDVGFPLPLKPNGLEKFPKVVTPSVLGPVADLTETEIPANNTNGWTDAITKDLQRTADKLQTSDIAKYVRAARNKEIPNKRLAISAPVFAVVAAVLSLLGCWPGIHLAGVAAACSIVAVLVSSFSNGGQIGMIFELYRNCAGYYAEMEQDIQSTMRIPVCQREDGELYHQKIALQLGRRDQMPLFSSEEKTAGKLF